MYPEKLNLDGHQHRTTRINEVVEHIYLIFHILNEKKKVKN
jgi:hypothetical protein